MTGKHQAKPGQEHIDLSRDPTPGHADHALPDDAKGPHPLVDLSRDPTPGRADHALPDDPTPDHQDVTSR